MADVAEGRERARRRKQVFAVVRFDLFQSGPIENSVTVKAVMPTSEEAQAEVLRLNELQRGKQVKYVAMATRYYAPLEREPTR